MSAATRNEAFYGTAAQCRLYGCMPQQVAPAPLEATLATARVSLYT
jgi:hypothetical protein